MTPTRLLLGIQRKELCKKKKRNTPTRSLRSSDSGLLVVPRHRLSSMGGRSFSVIAPKLWNSLPRSLCCVNNISEFKSLLKTHLFSECYTSDLMNWLLCIITNISLNVMLCLLSPVLYFCIWLYSFVCFPVHYCFHHCLLVLSLPW